MKFPYVRIFFVAFVIHLTNAAPLYNIDSILDELLEMNIRMGDVILRAKYEYEQLKTNELKDTLGKFLVQNNPIIQSTKYETNGQVNADQLKNSLGKFLIQKSPMIQSTAYGSSTKYESQSIDSIKEITASSDGLDAMKSACSANDAKEISFIGRTFDAIGNQWNNWFKKKFTDIDEGDLNGNVFREDNIIPFEPSNQLIDDQNMNSDGMLEKSADDTDSANVDSNNYVSSNNIFGNIDSGNDGSDNTVSGNAHSGNTDSSNLDFDDIDAGNLDLDNIEAEILDPDNIDVDNAISDQTNSDNADSDNIKEETLDPDNADTDDSGNADPENTDSTTTDSGTTNSGTTDSENTDSANADSDNADSPNTDTDNTASGSTCSDNEIEKKEQNSGVEASNKEENVGWFESAIDSIVNFFS